MRKTTTWSTKVVLVERKRRQDRTLIARRKMAAILAILALVLIGAGAAIVSHARTADSTNHARDNGSQENGSTNFSELEHGGLGS